MSFLGFDGCALVLVFFEGWSKVPEWGMLHRDPQLLPISRRHGLWRKQWTRIGVPMRFVDLRRSSQL